MNDIRFGKFEIGKGHRPFIIAEMSGNHNQSLDRALKMVEEAAKAGVQALKLQTYTADTMTLKGAYVIPDDGSLWAGRELYDLYKEAHTPWEWHAPIFDKAKSLGMIAFSTPFDESAVDFLETLNVPGYKVASFENTDWPLLKKVASTGKPVIMSTGAATLTEISGAVDVLRKNGCKELILLKCTSTYPADPADSNLLTIPHMETLFGCQVGLSDHTLGIGVPVASVALGATIIEKHFTMSRDDGGVDSAFSLEPHELKSLAEETERAWRAMGKVNYSVTKNEEKSRKFKRSIYSIREIKRGEKVRSGMIKVIRPGDGIPARDLDLLIGREANADIPANTPLNWDMF